jgi:hypothetical protein
MGFSVNECGRELTNGEDDHGDVAAGGIANGGSQHEAEGSDSLGDGDVPRALVELARAPGDGDGDGTGDQVGRAGEDQADGGVEAESLDNAGELGNY